MCLLGLYVNGVWFKFLSLIKIPASIGPNICNGILHLDTRCRDDGEDYDYDCLGLCVDCVYKDEQMCIRDSSRPCSEVL